MEFLTKLYRKSSNVIELGNTGIYAESLSYLDIYIKNYIEIKFNGLHVKIASPASYVLQKLLINDSRGSKRQKDLESINHILHYINLSKSSTNELKSLYETLPKKWKKKINKTISVYRLPLSL